MSLAGPMVVDARLFAGGTGFARTGRRLWWTSDFGATWLDATPPVTKPTQLQLAGVAVLADGHQWIVSASSPAGPAITLLRRPSPTAAWQRTTVDIGDLIVSPYGAVGTALSFIDADTGWLMISEQITHTSRGELLRTTDGGATWTVVASDRATPGGGAITFVSTSLGFLQQSWTGGYWVTRDGGPNWSHLDLPAPSAAPDDVVTVVGPPALTSSGTVVIAAEIATPVDGAKDGVALYSSTDDAANWTIQFLPSQTSTESYAFATADGTGYQAILRSQAVLGSGNVTWVLTAGSNGVRSFTDTVSRQHAYAMTLSAADPDHLWTLGQINGCRRFKTDCWNTTGLFASDDGGHAWHQLQLPT